MALVDDDEAITLRDLFAGMDTVDDAGAVCAMKEAATFLRERDLSFRKIVQQIEARGALLPVKVGAAIQLMDSTTLSEAESALAGARRLMRSCGLTFARIIGALEPEPNKADKFEQLKYAYQIEVERSREMAAELEFLRSKEDMSEFYPIRSPFKNFVMVATLLAGVVLTASIVSTITDLFRPANATAKPKGPAMVQRVDVNPWPLSQPTSICWRDRSIHGPCF
jgi:hypothetical protein